MARPAAPATAPQPAATTVPTAQAATAAQAAAGPVPASPAPAGPAAQTTPGATPAAAPTDVANPAPAATQSAAASASTPAATVPNAEAVLARTPRPATPLHRKPLISGTSLSELLTTGGALQTEQNPEPEAAQSADATVDPACESKLEQARERILNLIRERRPRFVPAFEQMNFRGNTIAVSVPTAELREEILRNKTGMLMRIAELADIQGSMELEVTVNEEIRAARPIKLEDRVKYMTDKNPLLTEFRKALDLEIE